MPTTPTIDRDYIEISGFHFLTTPVDLQPNDVDIFKNPENGEIYMNRDANMRESAKVGMRLPTDEEWENILQSMNGDTINEKYVNLRKKLKLEFLGRRYTHGDFEGVGYGAGLRSSTANDKDYACYRGFRTDEGDTYSYYKTLSFGRRSRILQSDSFDNSAIQTESEQISEVITQDKLETQNKINYNEVLKRLGEKDYGAEFGFKLHEFIKDFNL